jgi:hypothetical protein
MHTAVFVALFVVLGLVNSVSARRRVQAFTLGDSTVTVDGNSNEWWIQIVVNPPGASEAQLSYNGQTYTLSKPSWDHSARVFIGKPSSAIPSGATVTVTVYFGSQTTQAQVQWNFEDAPKYNGNGNVPSSSSPPSAPSSVGKAPSGVNLSYIYSMVARFNRQAGAYPQANVGGSSDPLLQRWKTALNNAISANGVTDDKTRSLIQALFAAETQTIYDSNGNAERDTSKDGTPAMNYSPLNMNKAMLKYIGFQGNMSRLNYASNINLTVATLLRAINKLTLNGFLNFHRGGITGYKNPAKYSNVFKMPQFFNGIYNMLLEFQQDHTLWTDGRKVWAQIPHV